MKILNGIVILAASAVLVACTSNISHNAPPVVKDGVMMEKGHAMKDGKMMKDAKMMKDGAMMKDSTMMKKGESCHNHAANSMTKSANHCHKSNQANHSHQYGG